ncbi:MAG: DUF934 domain-containing protein [Pseudomonadota bacterium]
MNAPTDITEGQAVADIWTVDGFRPDTWHLPDADASTGVDAFIALDAVDTALEAGRNAGLGILLQPGDDVTRLAPHLDRIALVAVAFPAYTDGRGYSMASLLRQRLGYDGELRAVGDVLLDQIPYMLRCGFTSFSVTHAPTRARLAMGDIPGVALYTQPAARAEGQPGGYSWRRGPRSEPAG